jgi:hypothetical protein
MANAFRPASSAALLLAAALAACSSSVQDLPPGGVVVCSSSGDCPSGTICQALLGRCISAASDDRQPPALVAGSSQVTPPAATAGTLVTVAFTVDEDLALDPEVRFDGATSLLGTPRRSGRSYTLSFPASAADGEGSHNVVARLVDLSGNVAATVPVGSLTLDFTPPSAAPPAVTPAFARSGSTLTAVISFSEPLDGSPTLAIDLGPALTATPGPGPGTWTFARTLDGSEPEGAVDLLLTARDPAGNELRRRTTAAAILDFTAPSVAASSIHTPAVRAGDTFVAEVHFDEPMGGLPTVVLAPAGGGTAQPVTAGEVDASTFALAYQVPAGAADGAFELRLTGAADRAGNPALPQLLGAVTLDSTPPAISGAIAVSPAKAGFKAGDQPSITFTASEAVPVPEASLGTAVPIDAPCVAAGPARTFTCTLSRPLAASDLPEGVNALLVKLTDAAGNVGYGSRALTLDYAPAGLSGAPVTQLIPGPGNLRTTIAALGPGSTLRVVLLASEPLSADPSVWAQSGQTGEILPLSRTSSNGTSYVYQLTLDSALRTPATWTLYWDPVDLAGNQWPAAGKPPVATFPVDGEAPAAPAVGTAAAPAITWERVPWGSQATGGAALYRVSGAASSVPGADLAVAWDGPAAGARELGRGAIGAGGFDVSLGADPAELYLSSVDPAGNESPRTRIVDVAWTAGLGGKVPGSTFENPHRLVRRTFSTRALAQNDDVEVAGSALGLAGDGLVVATDAASTFKPVSGTESPAARRYYALGYDAGRGAVVLYGGQLSGGSTPGDTWEWDGAEWRQVVPLDPEGDGNPPTWDGAAMAYDPIRGGVVLLTTNLWLWNGQSWRMLDYGMVAPGLQQFGAAAWDQARGVLVFFGGGFGNHTWEWDGTSWADVTPASPTDSPDGRSYHQLAWDPIRQRVVVFGGLSLTAPSGARNDLWAWDGTRWTQLTPSGTPPSGRTDFAMAWDAQNGELVVQGGYDAASVKDGKTFVLRTVSGTPTWLDLTPLGSPAFSSHRAVFDQRTNRVELFGDWSGPQLLQWAGSGSPSWIPRAPGDPEADGNPSFSWLTNDGSIAYDSSRGVVVYQDMRQQQTWEWNRASWARKANGTGVTPRSGGTIGNYGAYTILFGGAITGSGTGSAGDTWRWDGTSWTQLIASPPRSPLGHYATLREDVGMATDPVSGRLYRFGGGDQYSGGLNCYNDLQYWNGSAWVLQGGHPGSWADPEGDGSPASFLAGGDPTESCGPRGRVAWDEGRGSLVVYVPFQGFWEWKPGTNSWARHTMPVGPFSDEAVFYDRTLGAVVVLEDASAWVADLAADTWLPLPFANPYGLVPPANGLAAFDRGLGRLVGVELATWIWDAGTTASPAHLLRVDYSRANGPDPGACVVRAACPIQRVDVSWVGGGTSPSQDGAMLQAWTGDWLDAQATGASAAAPALVSWSWTPASPFPASSLFHGASRELTFELIPRGSTSAAGLARVATDAVEVTVRYRRP